ncbi:hypothetical protein [Glycomyces buryatensis]|uniref:Uncharacterized protein n=1 Tax=Glycomyces buryatensis TaxID=2570927 RepID=A0A4S8PVT9_9ACTN|nr:hypothetical protein [Glycomyces buryatensis]THV35707.1 hypothetical protein FAB82_22795 [Glycomyces buryatensis]
MIDDLFDNASQWAFDQMRDTSLSVIESLIALSMLVLNPLFTVLATPLASSFRLLVMGVYGLLVCVGGVIVMTSESLQERYSAREIVPRLIAGFLLSSFSPNIVWFIQDLNIDFVAAFTLGETMGDSEHGADFLDILAIEARSIPITLIDLVVAFLKLIGAFVLWLCMLTRNIAWFVVAVFAPVALACHALPFSEGVAWLWWRMLWACFGSSVGQAALIWVWANIYTDLDDIEVLGYYSLGPFYLLVLIWVAWRLHKDLFIWAKGTPLRIPGAKLAKTVIGSAIGIALFRANPVGRVIGLGMQMFRGRGNQNQQVPPAPPRRPQPPNPRPRPAPPGPPGPPNPPSQPALDRPPYVTGDSSARPPQRPGQGPTSAEQLPPQPVRGELEAAPPRQWKAGAGPERPPEPDGEPEPLRPGPVRRELETAPPGLWETGPAKWRASPGPDRSVERTADITPAPEPTAWDRLRRHRPRVETIPPPEPVKRPALATPTDIDRIKRHRRGRKFP